MENPETKKRINTHGLDLFLIGMIVFVSILALTVLAYKVFIRERVKNSQEYQTAAFFASNSETIQKMLLTPLERVEFDDLWIKEEQNFGICYVTFDLFLKDHLKERLGVGLVKVADFWIVYEAVLGQGTPAAYSIFGTYDKILKLIEVLGYQDLKSARSILEILKKEIGDSNLFEYLSARVNALDGNDTFAVQLLEDLRFRSEKARPAMMFERAMIHFDKREYADAAKLLDEILIECDRLRSLEEALGYRQSLFRDLPKDPLISLFDYRSVRADALQNLSLAHYHLQDYERALQMADQTLKKADEIDSSVIFNAAQFIKAMSFYELKRFEQADQFFSRVIENPENTNLSQKAWAYYYRALIADDAQRSNDSLDYFETAVNLDPFNFLIRKGAVLYLAQRGLPGDAQIALAFALRGIQYNVEKGYFQDLAAELSERLGVTDVSGEL